MSLICGRTLIDPPSHPQQVLKLGRWFGAVEGASFFFPGQEVLKGSSSKSRRFCPDRTSWFVGDGGSVDGRDAEDAGDEQKDCQIEASQGHGDEIVETFVGEERKGRRGQGQGLRWARMRKRRKRTSPWALPLVLLSRGEQAQQRYFSDTADEEGVSQSQFHRMETCRGDKICGVRRDCAPVVLPSV